MVTRGREWPLWTVPLVALVTGHSTMLVAFASHEILHGAGALPRWLRAMLSQIGWTFALFATPTVQHYAHNRLHHKRENTERDPDRRLTAEEIRLAKAEHIGTWLFPNARHPIASALVGFGMSVFAYHMSLFWHSVLRTDELYDVRLSSRDRRRVVLEGIWNATWWIGLWALGGFSGPMALYLALTYWFGATGAGLYIATNHLLCGLSGEAQRDPLASTVSLRLPAWIDALHLRFSHHVEHHLFPHASYRDLPAVRRALRARFPDRYQELSWGEALRRLLTTPLALQDKNTTVHPDGSGATRLLFPSHDEGPLPVPPRRPS